MFNQLLLIHLYRPFLKYTKTNTPLPSHVSPRKICTQAASAISKLLRMYKRTYGLKQICNIVVYIAHTACTIHLLNLPEKNAQRDIVHGLRNLEEMAECWLCARRTLRILDISANKWQVQLPVEASAVFDRTHTKWGSWGIWDQATSPSTSISDESSATAYSSINPVNSPGRFSPGGNNVPPVQRTEPIATKPTTLSGVSMGPQHPATTPMTASVPPMRIARRVFGAQAQRQEFPPPEPTYLRPLSQVGYQMPTGPASSGPSAPSPVPGGWYDTPGTRLETQPATPASNISSVSGYGGTENLVEESQDWWTRNATTMGIGVENWGPWTPDISTPTPHLQYGNNHANLMNMPSQPSAPTGPENQPQVTLGMPNSVLSPENGTPEYEGPWS